MGTTAIREHVAIALVSLTVVLFQILITRVLSVTLAYHFAFLAVSLAMLGLGAPGIWFSLRAPGPKALRAALWCATLALPASQLAIVQIGAPLRSVISFWVACLLVPMLALGSAVCLLLLSATGDRVGRMYAADLCGAALGAMLAVPLLHGLPTPSVIAALGVLPLVALLLLERSARVPAFAVALVLAGALAWGEPFHLRYTSFYEQVMEPLFERWTPTARLAVFPAQGLIGWGIGETLAAKHTDYDSVLHLRLDQDGTASTPILRHQRGKPYPAELFGDVTSAPYQIVKPRTACIIGGGGGRDILSALLGGAQRVEVVELNPYTVEAVSKDFAKFSGDPYHLPGVHAFVGEGRSHFSGSKTACDVFQISQIDTFAATAAGAYALTENSLYTVEAMRMYWSRLSADGVLSISRWAAGPGTNETARLCLLELAAIQLEGIADPRQHMVLLSGGMTADVLLFRKPLDAARLAEIDALAERQGFQVMWPLDRKRSVRAPASAALLFGPGPLTALGLDMSPSTDDRPFFFQTLDLLATPNAQIADISQRERSVTLLRRLLTIVFAVTVALIFLPLLAAGRLPRGPRHRRGTLYFVAIGLAFMLIEIPLVQRMALYLGHPSYATTVVLGALLSGAGVGAFLAAKVPAARRRTVALLVPLVLAALIVPLTGPIAAHTLQWALPARIALAGSMVCAAGLAMGLPFPFGMACFDGRDRSWYWAVNGAAGVLSSVLALVLALLAGFSNVTLLAFACYLIAGLALPNDD